jgi:hypothetical protein
VGSPTQTPSARQAAGPGPSHAAVEGQYFTLQNLPYRRLHSVAGTTYHLVIAVNITGNGRGTLFATCASVSPPDPPQRRLMDQVRDAIRVRHYSRRTEEASVTWIRRYIVFHDKTHPSQMGAQEISAFLTSLAVRERVSASTQNQALSALLFLYRHVLGIEVGSPSRAPGRSTIVWCMAFTIPRSAICTTLGASLSGRASRNRNYERRRLTSAWSRRRRASVHSPREWPPRLTRDR